MYSAMLEYAPGCVKGKSLTVGTGPQRPLASISWTAVTTFFGEIGLER
jgi:hypothetical protein